ncbi:hypothetical protein BH11PAT2_BH11PAT2_09940 [soil metagenome]
MIPFIGSGQFCYITQGRRLQGEIKTARIENDTLYLDFSWAKEGNGIGVDTLLDRADTTFELPLVGWVTGAKNGQCIWMDRPSEQPSPMIKFVLAGAMDSIPIPKVVS